MRRGLLAAAAGLALAVALPGLGWWPLAVVFPGLLLAACDGLTPPRAALLAGWAGLVHWAVATFWVVDVMHGFGGLPWAAAVLCLIVMAAYLALPWAAVGAVVALVERPWRPWLLPLAWTATEAVRQWPPYSFPWNPVAAAFAGQPTLLGSLPVWGASGLGWAAVMVGSGLWALARPATRRAGAVALCSALVLTVLATALAPAPVAVGAPLRVLLVQPGTTQAERWNPAMSDELAERVWQLSRSGSEVDLVLWPEGAVPWTLERDGAYLEQVKILADELGAPILLNSVGPLPVGYANSAYLVDERGVVGQRYDKVRLVQFGEYVPLLGQLAFTKALVRDVPSFTPGAGPVVMAAAAPLGVAICYEIVFADLVAAQVRAGATVLTTLTNDGWYGVSWAPSQHFAQAVLRAAETRRPVVRAALTGISGIVDAAGRVQQTLPVGATGVVAGAVQPTAGLTPRVRFGDWWALRAGVAAGV